MNGIDMIVNGYAAMWFMLGVGTVLATRIVHIIWRLESFRKRPCTSCGRKAVCRLVETYDFETHVVHRGVLCMPCSRYSDRIAPPPWA